MTESYKKVNYLLRLKKQIERKLLIETLQHIDAQVKIRDYHYFGFGSIYYADFILFHKYLNIKKMTSIDDKISDEQRFVFNKPFGFIDFKISKCHIYLETKLNWNDKLLIWLDYDQSLDISMINDIEYVSSKSKSLDIFFITIEGVSPEDPASFINDFRLYLPPDINNKTFKENFPFVLNTIVKAAISNGLNNQTSKIEFLQLFNLVYEDTKKMYTFGGIFCETNMINEFKAQFLNLPYIKHDNAMEIIDCPLLTPREKMYIDQCVHENHLQEGVTATGLKMADIEKYKKYYKYYPQFFESIY